MVRWGDPYRADTSVLNLGGELVELIEDGVAGELGDEVVVPLDHLRQHLVALLGGRS